MKGKYGFWRFLLLWTTISAALGALCGLISVALGAPFYLGFFTGLTLGALVALFVLAAKMGDERTRRR